VSELNASRLTCREVAASVTDYLEDALPALAHARVEAHLAACEDCTAYLQQMRATIDVVGRLRDDDVPAPVLDRLVRVFRGSSA
jgi:anti-sigma factor RsiW